ncbi:hypothetical protein CLOM621_08095 [Clostridium sp. M62/1]|nr:hypothetical protein CLOM621_08095 [Clostridium sp. M62/1]
MQKERGRFEIRGRILRPEPAILCRKTGIRRCLGLFYRLLKHTFIDSFFSM